jgi:hypothetical protein
MSGGWIDARIDFPCGCSVQRFGDSGEGRIDRRCADHDRRAAIVKKADEADLRARIAQEIEAASAEFVDRQDRLWDDHTCRCRACALGRENYIRATEHAARIARGAL